MFGGIVADPAPAADEQHCSGGERGHHHRIVTRARDHPARRLARIGDGGIDHGHQRGVARAGGEIVDQFGGQPQIALGGDARDRFENGGGGAVAARGLSGADVDGEADCARDHIGRAGPGLDPPDSGDKIRRIGARDGFDREDHRRRARQRIAAQRHRGGSGVPGDAGELHFVAQLRSDSGHGADGEPFGFEHRALLDMRFEIGGDRFGRAFGRKIRCNIDSSVGERDAVWVADVQRLNRERSGHRAAGEHGGGEARAFFIAECDDFDGEGQAAVFSMERGDAFDAQHNAERAIIGPAIAHAIKVAADDQRGRAGCCAFIPADQIGGGIDVDGHSGLSHPIADLRSGGVVGRGEIAAIEAAGHIAVGRDSEKITAGGGTGARAD